MIRRRTAFESEGSVRGYGQAVTPSGLIATRLMGVPARTRAPGAGSCSLMIHVVGTGSVPAGSDTTVPSAKPSSSMSVAASSTVTGLLSLQVYLPTLRRPGVGLGVGAAGGVGVGAAVGVGVGAVVGVAVGVAVGAGPLDTT